MTKVRLNYAADGSDQFTPAILRQVLDVVLSPCKIRTASSGGAMFPMISLTSILSLGERKPSAAGEGAFVL